MGLQLKQYLQLQGEIEGRKAKEKKILGEGGSEFWGALGGGGEKKNLEDIIYLFNPHLSVIPDLCEQLSGHDSWGEWEL